MTNTRKSPDTIYHIPGMDSHQPEMLDITPAPNTAELVATSPVREGDDITIEQQTQEMLLPEQNNDYAAEQLAVAPQLEEIAQLYAAPQEQTPPPTLATPERVIWITGPEAARRAHEYGSRIVHLHRGHALNATGTAA